MVATSRRLNSPEMLTRLLAIIAPLIEGEAKEDPYELQETQLMMGRLVQIVRCNSLEAHISLLETVKTAFAKGGPKHITYTLPTIVNNAIHAGLGKSGDQALHMFSFVHSTIEMLAGINPALGAKNYLHGLLALCSMPGEPNEKISELAGRFLDSTLALAKAGFGKEADAYAVLMLTIGSLEKIKGCQQLSKDLLSTAGKAVVDIIESQLTEKRSRCAALLAATHVLSHADRRACLQAATTAAAGDAKLTAKVLDTYVVLLCENTEVEIAVADEIKTLGKSLRGLVEGESDPAEKQKEQEQLERTVSAARRRAEKHPQIKDIVLEI